MNMQRTFISGMATTAMMAVAHVALASSVNAIEYVGTHVFITADPAEIAALDSGAIPGWKRTGSKFLVSREPRPELVPVCRFYRAGLEPANAHFYTAFPEECEALRQKGDWVYEGIAFHVWPVEACGRVSGGGLGMWRIYNRGREGIDAHRWTRSLGTVDILRPSGWVGEGPSGLAWCIERGQGDDDALAPGPMDVSLFDGSTWELTLHDYYGRDRRLVVRLGKSMQDGWERAWDSNAVGVASDLEVADRWTATWWPGDGAVRVNALQEIYSGQPLLPVIVIDLVLVARDRVEGVFGEACYFCESPDAPIGKIEKGSRASGRRL